MTGRTEEGAALLSVLLLLGLISVLVMSVLGDMHFGIRRAANAAAIGQAQWYALGAESFALQTIARLSAEPARGADRTGWNGRWIELALDEGAIRARLSDATTCFNLNSVVQGAPEQWSRRDIGLTQFRVLLEALGISRRQAESLGDSLADWIDSDGKGSPLGAEDEAYLGGPRAYRTAGALLSEPSELRAIRGFTPEIYALIRPYVCALPSAELSPININMLSAETAILLTVLTGGGIEPETARDLIASRPPEGWPSVAAFWSLPAFKDHVPADEALTQVSTRTRFFRFEAIAESGGGEAILTALIEQTPSGSPRLLARRWSVEE